MKKILSLVLTLSLAIPLLASAADAKKDRCLLDCNSCSYAEQNETIQNKIAKLKNGLNDGATLYSADELKVIGTKLNDYQSLLVSVLSR